MAQRPSAIPGYEDWPEFTRANRMQGQLAQALGVAAAVGRPAVTVDWQENYDGVTTFQLSWQTGFGPVSRGWLQRPTSATGELPGILAMHCHGGKKFIGASRLVKLPPGRVDPALGREAEDPSRFDGYQGVALASDLARRGFAVLSHDAFSWGSRRFPLDPPPWRTEDVFAAREAQWRLANHQPSRAERFDALADAHESTVAKAAGLFGSSFAGAVAHDDLTALNVLSQFPGVDASRLGTLGFSGGGGRALVLAALDSRIRSFVVTAMMTTFQALIPFHLDAHSWLLQTPGLAHKFDWPELARLSQAAEFLVQYPVADVLFPEAGMREAEQILQAIPGYSATWWPGGHLFTRDMQGDAFAFLVRTLSQSM